MGVWNIPELGQDPVRSRWDRRLTVAVILEVNTEALFPKVQFSLSAKVVDGTSWTGPFHTVNLVVTVE